jgi:3-oxoacyl-[acyl-carrier protein] reductase
VETGNGRTSRRGSLSRRQAQALLRLGCDQEEIMDQGDWTLVTGGSRGIGKAIVERLGNKGRPVIFTYLQSEAAAADLERHFAEGLVRGWRCDGRDPVQVRNFSDAVIAKHGAPRAVINNAGITNDALLLNMESHQWHEVIQTNLDSTYNITRTFLPAMIQREQGAIIQISSVSGLRGNVGQTNYSATKAALIGFSRSLALEVARFNLRVNVVAPGLIETELAAGIPEADRRKLIRSIPLRRLGNPNDVATLVEFLISDDASYITGQIFVVDGGLLS